MSRAKKFMKLVEQDDEIRFIFYRIVDLDERGLYRAHIEDEEGRIVFEYSNEEEVFDDEGEPTGEVIYGEIPMIADGYMKHKDDIEGLENYLKEMEIIPKDSIID